MEITLVLDGTSYTGTVTADQQVPPAQPPPVEPPVPPVVLPPAPATVSPAQLLVPAGILPAAVDELDALTNWQGEHDGATSGTGKGTTTYPVIIGGKRARAFPNDYTNHGGFRYHAQYAIDSDHTHFSYGGYLWFDDPTLVAQMELDNNQVTMDGKTYIFGEQFNTNDKQLDITLQDTQCHWTPSGYVNDPRQWPAKTWLPFALSHHRDNAGNVTYDLAHFNGTTVKINKTLPSARKIGPNGWTPKHCLVNFQLGGQGASGSIRAYASGLQVARW